MNKTCILLAVLAALGLSACARHVTVDPELVQQKNSPNWDIKSAPQTPKK